MYASDIELELNLLISMAESAAVILGLPVPEKFKKPGIYMAWNEWKQEIELVE